MLLVLSFCYMCLFAFYSKPWAVSLKGALTLRTRMEADGSVRHVKSMDFTEIANADADEGLGRGHDTL